jgi:DNA (cytosine-5)-methyltransferase 1
VIVHTLRAEGHDASEDGTGRGVPIVSHDPACTLTAREYKGPLPEADLSTVVAFDARQSDVIQYGDKTGPLDTDGDTMAISVDYQNAALGGDLAGTIDAAQSKMNRGQGVMGSNAQVRRLTPRECERLQGFPDDYTLTPYRNKPATDGPRYKALGNSMAVPVMAWLGKRIAMVEGFS